MAAETPRPFVILKLAHSVDGFLDNVKRVTFSSPEDLSAVQCIRTKVDAILLGANTVINDDPSLLVKDELLVGERSVLNSSLQPLRVVIEGAKKIPPFTQLFSDKKAKTLLYTKRGRDEIEQNPLLDVHYYKDKIEVSEVCHDLYRRGVRRLLVEGGAKVAWQFLDSGLVDLLRISFSPHLIANQKATKLHPDTKNLILDAKPRIQQLGQTCVAWYQIGNPIDGFLLNNLSP